MCMCVCFQTSFGEVMVHPMYLFPWPSFVVFQVPALQSSTLKFCLTWHMFILFFFFNVFILLLTWWAARTLKGEVLAKHRSNARAQAAFLA